MNVGQKMTVKTCIILLNGIFAILGAIGVFYLLFLISGELFFPVASTLFLVFFLGLVNYLSWGHSAEKFTSQKREVEILSQAKAEKTAPWNDIVLELDEQERQELVRMLEDSLVTKVINGPPKPQTQGENKDLLHQQMLDKLRMFGA